MKNGIYFTRAEMEKRIVFRCEKCDAILSLVPCPNGDYGFDHRCQPEKVTPKEGELIEVKSFSFIKVGYFVQRVHSGEIIITSTLPPGGESAIYPEWRYPGETDWRD